MPTYSYRCTECGTAFDIVQAFTDDSLTECPSCSGRLRKLFSAVGVTFSGSGFYRTDSRAEAKAGASSSTGAGSKGSESGSGSGTAGSTSSSAAPASTAASGSSGD
ncbi:MAG TPA: FmdB family zinc ribbon protein [Microbacteriaceae bacterium]|nr:FmdB family zinc ribbon protein [Microbacteriaceae bacterium]